MSDFRAINSAIIRVFILTFVSALENTIPFMSEITPIPVDDISSFVYGQHVEGEQVSFLFNGLIPAFKPNYNISVKSQRESLQENYTHLRTEYYNILSKIIVEYNPKEQILTFHIKYPFIDTTLGIVGFALPKEPTKPLPTF